MDLKRVRAFLLVADGLHFGSAARQLGIDHSALSRQIAQLEREVGARLLVRSTRRVELTPAGRVFRDGARTLLADAERLVRAVEQAQPRAGRVLNVGVSQTTIHSFVRLVLEPFRRLHPEIDLALQEVTGEEQPKALLNGRIDVGYVMRPVEDKRVRTLTLRAEPMVLALPADHRLASQDVVPAGALAEEVLLTPRRGDRSHPMQARLDAYYRRAGFKPKVRYVGAAAQTLLGLVKLGSGVAVVPKSYEWMGLEGIAYRPMAPATPSLRYAAIWLGESLSPVVKELLRFMRGLSA